MRFLFISNSKHLLYPARDASTRYRCLNPVEALNESGHLADLCTQQEFAARHLDQYDIYVFHRPRYTRRLDRFVNRLNRKNKIVIADYDDLLFAPELASFSPIVRNGQASERIARKLQQNYLAALHLFDRFTASTIPLAEQIRLKTNSASIFVVHNGYSPTWVRQAEPGAPEPLGITAGYFPGTKSHDRDFGQIARPLQQWLRSRTRKLLVVGPLTMSDDPPFDSSVKRHPHVPYHTLPSLISQCSVTLAPLENTPFNQCKSGIKFIESALFGVPVIATPIPDITRFEASGLLLADGPTAFGERLDQVSQENYLDAEYRINLARYALEHCSARIQVERLLGWLNLNVSADDLLTQDSVSPVAPRLGRESRGLLVHEAGVGS